MLRAVARFEFHDEPVLPAAGKDWCRRARAQYRNRLDCMRSSSCKHMARPLTALMCISPHFT